MLDWERKFINWHTEPAFLINKQMFTDFYFISNMKEEMVFMKLQLI